MKFFVDTADVNEIRELTDLGFLDGVTTNPSLILRSVSISKTKSSQLWLRSAAPLHEPAVTDDQ